MHPFTFAWVLFAFYAGLTSGKPTKHKLVSKKVDKRWDLLVNDDPILAQGTPSDCQSIVEDYSKGKLLMYEYKIQMKRCMNKAKEGASTADAKSALLRPDDSSTEEDSDQAVNVRPYNEHVTDEENDNHHDEFHENDNDNDYNDDDDDDDDEDPEEKPEKKMEVPGLMGYQSLNAPMMNYNMVPQQQAAAAVPELQTAHFYPTMDQAQSLNAAVPQQNQEAFAPSAINQYQANPAPLQSTVPNMAMNLAVAKSNIPGNTQPQNTASQANAVFDQWRASSFGATTADKKDQTPNAPAVPANDPFAEFMKMQSTSSNSLEAMPASQQAAMPAAVEQRSNIPQQPASMSVPMQPQITNTVPSQSQAFYVQPQENEDFPKNP